MTPIVCVAIVCASALTAWRWWISFVAQGRVTIDAKTLEARLNEIEGRVNRIEVQRMGL